MKSLTILFFVLFAIGSASAQGCLPEGITFETQAQIDSFQADHPGCTVIEGNVSIVSQWPHTISNLNGLSVLISIGGSLSIEYTYNLHNLNGLNALTSVGGSLTIDWNEGLTSLAGLENLSSLAGDLIIGSNTVLTNLSGLGDLTSIGASLNIWYNNSLTSLTGLESLSSIGGDLYIFDNEALITLSGLGNLISIGGNLSISSNAALLSISALANINPESINDLSIHYNNLLSGCEATWICTYLANPNGTVSIHNNDEGCSNPSEVADNCGITLPCLPYGDYYFIAQSDIDNFQENFPGCIDLEGNVRILGENISNLSGLNGLTSISGNLEISWNYSLTSLAGLENINHIGGELTLYHLDSLENLTGLGSLNSIGENVTITDNISLVSISGLNSLDSIGGSLDIYNNYVLSSLAGLESLSSIGENLKLGSCDWENGGYNPLLYNLDGLENLVTIGGNLDLQGTSLTSLAGLSNLTSIGGSFIFNSNSGLVNLTGLNNLNSIGGNFAITGWSWTGCGAGNTSLTSFSGLDNLNFIGGDISIVYNEVLSSLDGLDNLDNGSINNLTIQGNIFLSECEAQGICNYLAAPNGTIDIFNNAPGCNSPEEVEAACGVGIDNPTVQSSKFKVQSYPNPFSDFTTLEYELEQSATVNLSIYNHLGQRVAVLADGEQAAGKQVVQWDAEGLPAGIYYCRLTTDDCRLITCGKLLKL